VAGGGDGAEAAPVVVEEAEAAAPDGPLAQLDAAEKSADHIKATCGEVKDGLAASPADPVRVLRTAGVRWGRFAWIVYPKAACLPAPRAER
jgi:hypothetical protein